MKGRGAVAKKATTTEPAAPVIKITSCDEADRRGLELAQAHLKREALQNTVNLAKAAIDQKYAEELDELANKEHELQCALDAFAAKHKRAEDLNYIEIVSTGGSNAITYDVDEADVIKRIKRSATWAHLVKVKEFLNKRDLAKIPTKLHEKFGFRFGPTAVTFSVKPKIEAVRIHAERAQEKHARDKAAARSR
jgi:hypothetical protein